MIRFGLIFISTLSILSGCGANQAELSKPSYLILDKEYYGLSKQVELPVINACVEVLKDEGEEEEEPSLAAKQASPQKKKDWFGWTKQSVLAWINPLREVSPGKLADDVRLIDGSKVEIEECLKAHVVVHISSTVKRAYTIPGDIPEIFMHPGDDDYMITLHEMGHAFGLDDTYAGKLLPKIRVQGMVACKPGQPDSVMCSATYQKPQADDIKGIRAIHQLLLDQ